MGTKKQNLKLLVKNIFAILVFTTIGANAFATSGVVQNPINSANKVVWQGQTVDQSLRSDGIEFRAVSKNLLNSWSMLNILQGTDNGMVLGFPRGLIGERNVFGGVVTAVSDAQNETLGSLKLSDITPLHVQTALSKDESHLILKGCPGSCNELSEQIDLYSIPIMKTDAEFVYLDLKAFGSGLEIIQQMGDFSLPAVRTEVTSFDFSLNTLVFDVVNYYEAAIQEEEKPLAFNLTTRWYLKLSSGLSNNFEPRPPTPEAGFFTTDRNSNTLIKRFALDNAKPYVTKYYVKSVPAKFKKAFADSFEDWNTRLQSVVDKKFFEYEFIDANDPRSGEIVMGDVRYNVIEWDLLNKAGYGGLGPSIASQTSGEIFSANVSIQGPTIIALYTKWWKVSKDIKMLESQGLLLQAQALKNAYMEQMAESRNKSGSAGLAFGPLTFSVHSANPVVADPALDPSDFLETPSGFNFDTYMYGYFRDMVAHELGHNIGLRHNFKGSLGANENQVSRSVMEYLDRETRHLDRVGEYDVMAVSYGYRGVKPKHSDWFCTDEDQASNSMFFFSAECTSGDTSSDPFAMLLDRLHRATNYLLLPGSELAPFWDVTTLANQIKPVVQNLANYYVSSFSNAATWTNFNNEKRKLSPEQAPSYILREISNVICSPDLDKIAESKSDEGKLVAKKNLQDLRRFVQSTTAAYTMPRAGFTKENFSCFE